MLPKGEQTQLDRIRTLLSHLPGDLRRQALDEVEREVTDLLVKLAKER